MAERLMAKVELYKGSTLAQTCTCADVLQQFTVTRDGLDSKLFGFGICHKLNVELIDMENNLDLDGVDSIRIGYDNSGTGELFTYPYPTFYSIKQERNETENTIILTGYDVLDKAQQHTVSEVTELDELEEYYPTAVLDACARFLGLPEAVLGAGYDLSIYEVYGNPLPKPNLDGTETIREVLNAVAELLGGFYFIDANNCLVMTCINDYATEHTIGKDNYYELVVGEARALSTICSETELGDNLETAPIGEGVTQYIRNNPFFEAMESTRVAQILDWLAGRVCGKPVYQFTCDWDDEYFFKPGTKLALEKENGELVYSYLLNDTTTFDGAATTITQWIYNENDSESASNPTNLGEALNKTFAKVDKANQTIELVSSKTDSNGAAISALQINTDSISASVIAIENNVDGRLDEMGESIETLTKEVSAKIDADGLQIAIETELQKGVNKVTTTTGYSFDDNGLSISKSDSEISTTITEDGMTVYKNNTEVLTANNQGVQAEDLHATTYLLIGNNSRFEDYDNGQRTGCFWIGG